ncbi:hypothetical protein FVE85_4329 [Porphyridium purpureum]|uniref:Uncharacterized protein n=1 Tax=Porphyridium purpureum TaxID=35688 RepID=A0A5J4YUH5_PORPP|nr:hypothetical protein FVE85_4329 [Porphyridium purpureum]|eukprot:POR0793..scf229_5
MLEPAGLVAFVPDGAILLRLHGASELPMPSASALPFSSPDALRVSMTLPSGKTLTGMGIRKGVNLIVGGGFHGKVCLVPGFCVQRHTQDGRAVTTLDISPFISKLPFERATNGFSTADASGSTSQAANITEALEMGCDLLIFDEDTYATNFMYLDAVMSALVGKHKKPITPFLEHCYKAYDVSDEAKRISCTQGRGGAQQVSTAVLDNDAELSASLGSDRKIHLRSLAPAGGSKVYVRDMGRIQYGSEEFAINLRALEQLVELGQTRLIADAMHYVEMVSKQTAPVQDMKKLAVRVEAALDAKGLDAVAPSGWKGIGYYSRPRPIELAAAINRWRLLKVSIDASAKD